MKSRSFRSMVSYYKSMVYKIELRRYPVGIEDREVKNIILKN
jgi:hypothetical protein